MDIFRCTITLISNWCTTWHLYYSILSPKRFTCRSCHLNTIHSPFNQLSQVNPMQLSWYILSLSGKTWWTSASQLVLGLSVWRAIIWILRLPLRSSPPWPAHYIFHLLSYTYIDYTIITKHINRNVCKPSASYCTQSGEIKLYWYGQ